MVHIVPMQAALKPGKGWSGLEDAFKLLPGPHFEIQQTVDEAGLPTESSAGPVKPTPGVPSCRMPPAAVF